MLYELYALLQIYKGFSGGQEGHRAWLAIACFLAAAGADLDHKNSAGRSPIDDVVDSDIRDMLRKHAKYVLFVFAQLQLQLQLEVNLFT